jgi:hypothetical protein
VAKKGQSKRSLLENYLAEANPATVTEADWREIRDRLAPISEGYLRQLLRASGRPLAPLVDGVRQESFGQLRASLITLAEVYAASDPETARRSRRLVIEAKDHARWAARSPKIAPEKKAEKEEMMAWMLTWLENPGVFSAWVHLRLSQPPPLVYWNFRGKPGQGGT